MNSERFWQKAIDFYKIYYNKHQYAILTDEEMRETVSGFINDIVSLIGEWCSSKDNNTKENLNNDGS
jgi:hypothetical protein